MAQKEFAQKATAIFKQDPNIEGLVVGGSWLTNELDEFSDLDLILVTKEKISGNKASMIEHAGRLGNLLSAFTGEHVGESRVLICLFDDPLLHVDIKFLTLDEFGQRVETPHILLDKEDRLSAVINQTKSVFPYPDYQWIEDRFWIWVHYALLKIGRGEYFETIDFFSAMRSMVIGPLLHIKNGNLPRGVRKVETMLKKDDLDRLKKTLPAYSRGSLLDALQQTVDIYRDLRKDLFSDNIVHQANTEKSVMAYFSHIRNMQ